MSQPEMGERKTYYPPEWDNDQSMSVLFSPFRENRNVNPQSWDKKLKFWTEMIFQECTYCKSGLIEARTLPLKFQRKGKTPVCMGIVLQQLFREGKIQRLSDFRAGINIGWLSWGFSTFVTKPLSWTFGKLFGGGSSEVMEGDFVALEVVKTQAEAVLERHHSSVKNEMTDHVVEYSRLQEQCQDICPDEDSLQLVLVQLIKEGKAAITQTDKQERIVRFAKQNKRSVTPLSDLELKVMRLQKAEEHLQSQVMQASEEMERCRTDAKFYLAKGMKNSAKNALRRKKTMERVMEKREGALETLHSLMQKIKDTESDKMILDAYAAGSSALKEIFNTHNLSTDNIDDVMCDVQETFDMQEEINATMSQGVQDPALDVSTADLEAELEELLSGDTSQDMSKPAVEGEADDLSGRMEALKVIEELDNLPSVPQFDPATPPKATGVPAYSAKKASPILAQNAASPFSGPTRPVAQIPAHPKDRSPPQYASQAPTRFSPSRSPPSGYEHNPSFTANWGGANYGQYGQREYGSGDMPQFSSPSSGYHSADRTPPEVVGFSDFDSSFPSPPRGSPREMSGSGETYLGPNPPRGFPQHTPPRRQPQQEYRRYQNQMYYNQ